MDYCGSFPDYRHTASGIGGGGGGGGSVATAGYHHSSYNQSSVMRYPPQTTATSMYNRGGSVRTPNMYDGYDRFGYQNTPFGYNGNVFGYNQPNNIRENGFYGHHPYDEYRMPPTYPYHHQPHHHHHHQQYHHHNHNHHREHYNADILYGPRNGFIMRDTPSYQYPGPGRGGEFSPYQNTLSIEFYPNHQHTVPNIDTATAGASPHHSNGSIYGAEYPTVPSSSSTTPFANTGPNSFPPTNLNATGLPFNGKDNNSKQPRKSQRDKNLSKLAAMNRRLECMTPMINEIDRVGTPFPSNLHDNYPLEAQSSYTANFSQNLRFHNECPPSTTLPIPNWHSAHSPTTAAGWMNGPYGPRPYRKRMLTPEPQVSPMLPSIRPPSQPNTTIDYQKIANGVYESDFIPSKKKRKNKTDNEEDALGSSREELQNITPLPGFQQAFGSTEIGRFSEVFFNAPESPLEQNFESEADTLSPQLWEGGDSLEGPHISLHVDASMQSMYTENYAESYTSSIDSPASNSYFSEIRCNDY